MTNRKRRIRPHERAKVDQHLAAAHELGANDRNTAVFAIEYADPGMQCCWCDCTLEQHQLFGDCDGCRNDAAFINHAMVGTPDAADYPVCKHHQPDFVGFWKTFAFPGIRRDVIIYDAYDHPHPQ